MNNRFEKELEKLNGFSLPRYAELPEIELYMDQVISVAEKYLSALAVGERSLITPSMINNYVKNGVIPPPHRKRYTREHLAAIIIICALKSTVEIQDIALVVNNSTNARGMEKTFDTFAEQYEAHMAAIVEKSRATAQSDSDHAPYKVIVENAILSSTARIAVEYAMNSIDAPKAEQTDEEPRRRRRRKATDDEDGEEISILPVI